MAIMIGLLTRYLRTFLLLVPVGLLSACYPRRECEPTDTRWCRHHSKHIGWSYLPGHDDDLEGLKKNGIAQIIQREWPDADVELAALTMAYYLDGHATKRLHDEVVEPAMKYSYQEIWLAGISLGGMGALTYDHDYPGDIYGMILLAPYLGDGAVPKEIATAGGLAQWNPGPPEAVNPQTWQRELWRYLKTWSNDPGKARHVWLGYGDSDRVRKDIELMSPTLRSSHILIVPGEHNWQAWKVAASQLLHDASGDEATPPAHRHE